MYKLGIHSDFDCFIAATENKGSGSSMVKHTKVLFEQRSVRVGKIFFTSSVE